MPFVNGMEYLISHLNDLGWVSNTGMGIAPITFKEIQAYNELTNSNLSGDEVLILRKMSIAYSNELQDKNPHKKPPYKHTSTD